LISGAIAIVLAIFGNRILSIWTHGQVAMNTPVFMLLLLGVIVNSFWSSSMVALLATNQHGRVAVIYFIATAVSLLAACALMRSFGLIGVAVAMLSVDGTLAAARQMGYGRLETIAILLASTPMGSLGQAERC
jgi:O-antigen/teichoic acid export membrane protein